jgi:hypothetical protein
LLSVEDWAEIRRLYRAEGLPIKMIARTLGISAAGTTSSVDQVRGPARHAHRCEVVERGTPLKYTLMGCYYVLSARLTPWL